MGRIVDFGLGKANNLSSRRLRIFRLDAGGATMTSVYDVTLAGNAEVASTELSEGQMYQARLDDARGGDTFKPTIINFSTGVDAMPRGGQQSGELTILHWEDTSSSSSTSTASSSSSSTSTASSSSSSTSSLSSSSSS